MSAFECMRRVYRTDGLRGFYRGMSASYAGISETVIHFVIYENIKRRLMEAKATQNMDEEEETSKDVSDFIGMMLAAATSKTCATTLAYPHALLTRIHHISNCRSPRVKRERENVSMATRQGECAGDMESKERENVSMATRQGECALVTW
ncbi:hypothetical protein KUCAC02_032979, partial [Chaenocephalus aceratus]